MRYYFQTRREARTVQAIVEPKIADTHGVEWLEVDAGYYLHVYEASGSGEGYDLSAEDLSAFGVWAQ